jgi:hypothetical protein
METISYPFPRLVQPSPQQRRRALLWATAATLLGFAWQACLVHVLYGGDWTSLFYQGDHQVLPEALRDSYIFHNSAGFDGQYYRVVAHDPLARGDLRAVDAPVLRYRRILVPGLAYVLGLGVHPWIDRAYDFVILASLFLGAYWAALLVSAVGFSPAWGMAYLLVPGVFCGIERAAVDIVLISLTLGSLWYALTRNNVALYGILLCAPLARETGICLTAGFVLWYAVERQWRRAALFATSALPALFWFAYLARRMPPDTLHRFTWIPLEELWLMKFRYDTNQVSGASHIPGAAWLQVLLYYCAVAAAMMAFYLAVRHLRTHLASPHGIALLLFTFIAVMSFAPGLWFSAYNFTRVFAPLAILLAWEGLIRKQISKAVPLMVMAAPPLLVPAAKAWQILRGVAG